MLHHLTRLKSITYLCNMSLTSTKIISAPSHPGWGAQPKLALIRLSRPKSALISRSRLKLALIRQTWVTHAGVSDWPESRTGGTRPTSVAHWGCQNYSSRALGCQNNFGCNRGVPDPLQLRIGGKQTDTFNCWSSTTHWYDVLFSEIKTSNLLIWISSFQAKNISFKQKKSSAQQQLSKRLLWRGLWYSSSEIGKCF